VDAGGATHDASASSGRSVALRGTGLYANRARFYSPILQRFISEDPTEFAGGPNVYAYVSGSPMNFVDPLGLDEQRANKEALCLPNVNDFVNANLDAAETLAGDLPNGATAQEVLATAGAETGYGQGLAAYGNYFGLHGTGFAGQTGTYKTTGGVLTPTFPLANGFLLSGQVFVNTEAPFLAAVDASDPQTFFQTTHAHGYGTTNPQYVDQMMRNTPTNHGAYALVGACLSR
jgi:RHS repeat-associated protein